MKITKSPRSRCLWGSFLQWLRRGRIHGLVAASLGRRPLRCFPNPGEEVPLRWSCESVRREWPWLNKRGYGWSYKEQPVLCVSLFFFGKTLGERFISAPKPRPTAVSLRWGSEYGRPGWNDWEIDWEWATFWRWMKFMEIDNTRQMRDMAPDIHFYERALPTDMTVKFKHTSGWFSGRLKTKNIQKSLKRVNKIPTSGRCLVISRITTQNISKPKRSCSTSYIIIWPKRSPNKTEKATRKTLRSSS